MTEIDIRPLAERDEEDWRRLWRGYLDFYETSVPDAVYDSSFQRMLAGNGGAVGEFRGLIATVDGGRLDWRITCFTGMAGRLRMSATYKTCSCLTPIAGWGWVGN